jgi:secreted Zn-dependent insulinase-like peptidase
MSTESTDVKDVHALSLVELKQLAKINNPPIKYYYIKSRVELIQILTSEFTEQMKIEKLTIHQLRKEARDKGHLNVWKMRRPQLVDLLYSSPKEDKKNDDHTEEHDDPKEGKGKDVRVEV